MYKYLLFLLLATVWVACQTQNDASKNYRIQMQELIEIGERCYERELFWGTGGDISVRISGEEKFLIKGTGTSVGDLNFENICTVNFENELLHGPKPSHETPIHAKIYKQRPEVGAILHMHAPYTAAFATVGLKVPAVTQQSVSLLQDCGIIPYYPVGSPELVKAVAELYENAQTMVVFMENHGAFVVGKDLPGLLYNAEKLENTARIAYICKSLGTTKSFKAQVVY